MPALRARSQTLSGSPGPQLIPAGAKMWGAFFSEEAYVSSQAWEGIGCGDGPSLDPWCHRRVSTFCSLVPLWSPMTPSRVLGLSELIFLDQGRSSGFKKNGSLGIEQFPLPAQ